MFFKWLLVAIFSITAGGFLAFLVKFGEARVDRVGGLIGLIGSVLLIAGTLYYWGA